MNAENQKPTPLSNAEPINMDLSATGWQLEVIGMPDFPDRPDLPLYTPTLQIRSPQGTLFLRKGGGLGENWLFDYSNAIQRFEFSIGKIGGTSQRDVGPNAKGTAHEIGPFASLYVRPNDGLISLSDGHKRQLLEEILQFIGFFSRHTPRNTKGSGMNVVVDQAEAFQRQWHDKLDGLLGKIFADLIPVARVEVWHHCVLGAGTFILAGTDDSKQ